MKTLSQNPISAKADKDDARPDLTKQFLQTLEEMHLPPNKLENLLQTALKTLGKGEDSTPPSALDEANLDLLRQQCAEIQKAKEAVRPLAGQIFGMDSASPEAIYRYGLSQVGVRAEKINLEGLQALTLREVNARAPHPKP
ncbi:hypothetical protein FAI40_04455 [Acetobacteraceae bacterium]|nr:hypothetical protein FAI40_04455 [Acetobacteraceae bacterium]